MRIFVQMKLFRSYILVLFCFILGFSTVAQTRNIITADLLFQDGRYLNALKYYEKGIAEGKKLDYLHLKMAQCYNALFLGEPALNHVDTAFSLSKYPSLELYKTKGIALQLLYKFDDAIKMYKKANPNGAERKYLPKRIRECTYGKKYLKNPVDVTIENVGEVLNGRQHDLLPKVSADGKYLFFTASPPKEEIKMNNLQDIYKSRWDGSTWQDPVQVPFPISDPENNDAVVGVSPDGQTMFLFRGTNGGDILKAEIKGGEWQKPKQLPFNTIHKESSITISPDGKMLLFVRKSKLGRSNIYVCKLKEDGKWSTPRLLDKTINSAWDEESPFLHPDGKTLFFSSKGHSTMGGYDIFKSVLTDGKWSTPENLGYPVNTTGDDFCFVLSADGTRGFYSSQRADGYGGQDIYEINFKGTIDAPELTLLHGVVTRESTGETVEAEISIWDLKANQQVASFRSNKSNGEYLVSLPAGKNYRISIDDSASLFHSEHIYLPEGEGYASIEKDIALNSIKKGASIRLNNVFFSTGEAILSKESDKELETIVQLLQDYPKVRIEIGGHTDNIGTDEDNNILSKKRAEAVVNYLHSKGVSLERLLAKGYGSTFPIADNRTEEGRKQNRRTEMKVIE